MIQPFLAILLIRQMALTRVSLLTLVLTMCCSAPALADDPCEGFFAEAQTLLSSIPVWDQIRAGGYFDVSSSTDYNSPDESHSIYRFDVSYHVGSDTLSYPTISLVVENLGAIPNVAPIHTQQGGALLVEYAMGAAGRVQCGYVGFSSRQGELEVLEVGGHSVVDIDQNGQDELVSHAHVMPLFECFSMADLPSWPTIHALDEANARLLDVSGQFPAFYRGYVNEWEKLLRERDDLSADCRIELTKIIASARGLAQLDLPSTSTPDGIAAGPSPQPTDSPSLPATDSPSLPASNDDAYVGGLIIVAIVVILSMLWKRRAGNYPAMRESSSGRGTTTAAPGGHLNVSGGGSQSREPAPSRETWFNDLFKGRVESPPKQGWFESNRDYRDRVYREGKERIIEDTADSPPKQGWFESDDAYRSRIAHEANERVIETATGSKPAQGWFESEEAYRERTAHEANERLVEGATGSKPKQGFFESNESYHSRISHEANERVVEEAKGSKPSQGFFESDDDYRARVNREAKEIKASRKE